MKLSVDNLEQKWKEKHRHEKKHIARKQRTSQHHKEKDDRKPIKSLKPPIARASFTKKED